MPNSPIKTAVFDIETDNLLHAVTKIHVLSIQDVERDIMHVFRQNADENTIPDGIKMLENVKLSVSHNGIAFDLKVIKKLYPSFVAPPAADTLVLARAHYADIKKTDFDRVKKKTMPSHLIGRHGLEAWGYRLGMVKGDYTAECEAKGISPWAAWSVEMEDYCINDVYLTELLWLQMNAEKERAKVPDKARELETQIHTLMVQAQVDGTFFDKAAAETLAAELETGREIIADEVIKTFGSWYGPAKKYIVGPRWDDPAGVNAKKEYAAPRDHFNEDSSRAVWGEVTCPRTSRKATDRGALHQDRVVKMAPFCRIQLIDFNPNSRVQIIDRLNVTYGWTPGEFTELGNPEVNDDILEALGSTVPIAAKLASLMYFTKRLGQIKNGAQAWLKAVSDEGKVHTTTNVGGTVTGRATHSNFNISQVPSVVVKNGIVLQGLAGKHGWECRSLFYTPEVVGGEPWTQLGADLKGIELRCLAEVCAPFDDGELIKVILSGEDIHAYNMRMTGITDRTQIKRGVYALMYGAGDTKLGWIIDPLSPVWKQKKMGREFRDTLMRGLPALKKAIDAVKKQAANGYIVGLDGRHLAVRSEHSALNTQLQGMGALVAKKWACLIDDYLQFHDLKSGWDQDYTLLTWSHDELQRAIKTEHAELAKRLSLEAAIDAGEYFGLKCLVEADCKIGPNWACTH
jgi:DNA polymerase family A/RNase_H superfamily